MRIIILFLFLVGCTTPSLDKKSAGRNYNSNSGYIKCRNPLSTDSTLYDAQDKTGETVSFLGYSSIYRIDLFYYSDFLIGSDFIKKTCLSNFGDVNLSEATNIAIEGRKAKFYMAKFHNSKKLENRGFLLISGNSNFAILHVSHDFIGDDKEMKLLVMEFYNACSLKL